MVTAQRSPLSPSQRLRGPVRQTPGSQGTKSQVCDLRVFAPHHHGRACHDLARSTMYFLSSTLLALLRTSFLRFAGKVQARRALPQADWQALFQLFLDMTRVSNHAATLHVVDTGPPAAAAALAAWWVHSCGPCVSLQHAAPPRTREIHRHTSLCMVVR